MYTGVVVCTDSLNGVVWAKDATVTVGQNSQIQALCVNLEDRRPGLLPLQPAILGRGHVQGVTVTESRSRVPGQLKT
jgi:hypothetical protein